MPKKTRAPWRRFLNPVHGNAFYEIEEDGYGPAITISDCNRRITLDFEVPDFRYYRDQHDESNTDREKHQKKSLKELRERMQRHLTKHERLLQAMNEVRALMLKKARDALVNLGLEDSYCVNPRTNRIVKKANKKK